jgi:DHA1 family multidrug resistance protein-like MFS transporter
MTEKQRGLLTILADTFLMWAGFFMVIPVLSVHYVEGLGWSATSIGLVLAVRQLAQQGIAVYGGALADRISPRTLICTGMLVRAAGFASLAFATTLPLLLGSAFLAALGGSLFDAPRSAAITALTTPRERRRFFSLAGTVGGLGMVIGPMLGAALLQIDFAVVVLTAAASYLVTFALTRAFLPPIAPAARTGRIGQGLALAARDRTYVLFVALLGGYWFMWVQINITLVLTATELAGTSAAVGWVYALNAGLAVLLQYPLTRLVERRLDPVKTIAIGAGLMAAGLAAVSLAGSIGALLGCVVLFSIGAALAQPSQQAAMASLANPSAIGSYFGFGSLSMAVGGGLGNLSGGALWAFAQATGFTAVPWLIFGAVGAVASTGLFRLRRPVPATVPPPSPQLGSTALPPAQAPADRPDGAA